MDHFFIAVYMRRKVQFMAKSQLFKGPMQFIYEHGGVFPIRRGHRDEEGLITARTVLGRGNIIVMYAEGGRSRTEKLGDPKPGIGKLALETGAPVVPSAIVGSAKVRNWKKLQFPKVTVQYGDPIRFEKVENPTREQAAGRVRNHLRGDREGLLRARSRAAASAPSGPLVRARRAAESVTTRRPTTQ